MKRVLVTGYTGLIGARFVEMTNSSFKIIRAGRKDADVLMDLTDGDSVLNAIVKARPDVVINFAAVTDVDGCEKEDGDKTGAAYKTNALGPRYLALACKQLGVKLIHISTDYIFSGDKSDVAYAEEDAPNPVSWYGKTKYYGELEVLSAGAGACIVRTSMPFVAKSGRKLDLVRAIMQKLGSGGEVSAISDNKITPTFVDDVVSALILLINVSASGIYHVANTSWHSTHGVAGLIAGTFNLSGKISTKTFEEYFSAPGKARRPKNSWLSTEKFQREFGGVLHTVPQALEIMKRQMEEAQ
jgi:dTDP-4-dehydrorhamnose reductase